MRFLLSLFFAYTLSAQIRIEPRGVKVLSYNLYNYNSTYSSYQLKSQVSRQAVASIIAEINADIVLLSELGPGTALKELLAALKERGLEYTFISRVEGPDQYRQLCVLAKFKPVKIDHRPLVKFKLKNQEVPVSRGFAYCVFEWQNQYRLHFVGAHLKSKMPSPLGQTDQRRYEARQLHYLIDEIMKSEEQANIIVAGDMNDTYESSAIKEIQYRRYKSPKRLFDLRPFDKTNASWTHYYDKSDEYSRIDYLFASYWMLDEIDYTKLAVHSSPHWFIASDHRPLLMEFKPKNIDSQKNIRLFENATRKNNTPQYLSTERFEGLRKARKSDGSKK